MLKVMLANFLNFYSNLEIIGKTHALFCDVSIFVAFDGFSARKTQECAWCSRHSALHKRKKRKRSKFNHLKYLGIFRMQFILFPNLSLDFFDNHALVHVKKSFCDHAGSRNPLTQ